MTKQEIFDIVWNGIFSQGGPSTDGKNCLYRGENNRKCAAGFLIPDQDYRKEFENAPAHCKHPMKYTNEFFVQEYFQSKNIDFVFVGELQNIHDDAFMSTSDDESFLVYWKQRMKDFAKEKELTIFD